MSLFGKKEQEEIERLKAEIKKEHEECEQKIQSKQFWIDTMEKKYSEAEKEIERLKAMIPPEQFELDALRRKIGDESKKLSEIKEKIKAKKVELSKLKSEIIETNDEILMQSFGLYTPHYDFVRAEYYKDHLTRIRTEQKNLIRNKLAATGLDTWTVNGSSSEGKKMVADMQKLLIRAFNSECDDIISHVTYSNIDSCEKRITASRDAISNLGRIMRVSITTNYYRLKIDELHLAFEYQQKKQEEKEAAKELRAQMREEAKLAKEIEESRKKLEKEQTHYLNALQKLDNQIETAEGETKEELLKKKADIEQHLIKIKKDIEEVDYREANQKAGYVYIISNIGAFGENVYKIGMTRRLNPMERVDELGDASVPFNFDVHAMIFSEDAPKLENALHQAFADRKLNFVNQRREFFNVSLDEIKEVVKKNYDKTVEFIDVAPAEQYRETLLLKKTK